MFMEKEKKTFLGHLFNNTWIMFKITTVYKNVIYLKQKKKS